jgi:carbamoyl-phosphate synthase large subunit
MIQESCKKVIILGSAALKIGEAGEFDYSGSQAIKALREEGISTILVNPNIATIQTSDGLADKVYFLPVNQYFVEKVIEKERPDGILLSFGGQTALNCGLQLEDKGVFEKFNVKVLGTPVKGILETEDRDLFMKKPGEIAVKVPLAKVVHSSEEALSTADEIGFPVMLRIGYALGGLGSGICNSSDELKDRVGKALSYTNHVLIEEYLKGWKEVEYEVMRDSVDNCITVCNMENFDPLGIHTGESIVVAPSQTLSNKEYHKLREISIKVIRYLGIVGECNIQFALDPCSDDYRVIEVNARLSRSSALASKATGYPLAFIAAKLALGFTLVDLVNSITKMTMACFEPALDYIVVKIPRWDLKKFKKVSKHIGSGMMSVGEVMSIGRSFEEALQKALRMLEIGVYGLVGNDKEVFDDLESELQNPTDERIFAIKQAISKGFTIEDIHNRTRIDRWFLHKINHIVEIAELLKSYVNGECPAEILIEAKQAGFSDRQIGQIIKMKENEVRRMRKNKGIIPSVKQIDTLAAEYPAVTNYLYLTFNGIEDDISFDNRNSVIVLGSGAYCIGSSVEFDWCCVNTITTLKNLGYKTIMVNYNPETVSTDYDECDRLYFDELTLESLLSIYEKERPIGVIISMGGQIPNSLAMELHRAGVKILGTSPESIDSAENRHKFSNLLDELNIDQPTWKELTSFEEAKKFAEEVGYPVLVRPSYVLSGAAMAVAVSDKELERFLMKAEDVSSEQPVVLSKFIVDARELEMDAVASEGELVLYAISEHVENAGVHSGDATIVFPPQRTYLETLRRLKKISRKIAAVLKINGPFNIQFIAKENDVKVIECNLRASRSFPFVSKVSKTNFIDIATRTIMGYQIKSSERSVLELDYVGVKAPQFSFTRLNGADPALGVEMSSTGEVGCLGNNFEEALLKALISVGYKFPVKNVLLSTGPIENKIQFLPATDMLRELGVKIYATKGTADFINGKGIECEILHWPLENMKPDIVDFISNGKIDLVINIPKNFQEKELTNDYIIRRKAADYGIPLITDLQLAKRFVEALAHKILTNLEVKSWDEY